MAAIPKKDLERLEAQYGLDDGGLSYQHRCSRITAIQKGEEWSMPEPAQPKRAGLDGEHGHLGARDAAKAHPLYGKRILITPMMTPDAKRAIAFDEPVGHEIQVREAQAGDMIYGSPEDVDRMVGDYVVVREDKNKTIMAKTTFPKIGTEISWLLGKELCPVVRGNDGSKGYVWSLPTSMVQVENTMIQVYGLKTLITMVYPELLEKFKGKPMMSYVDGMTLAASIPMTEALLKEQRRKELLDAKAGLV